MQSVWERGTGQETAAAQYAASLQRSTLSWGIAVTLPTSRPWPSRQVEAPVLGTHKGAAPGKQSLFASPFHGQLRTDTSRRLKRDEARCGGRLVRSKPLSPWLSPAIVGFLSRFFRFSKHTQPAAGSEIHAPFRDTIKASHNQKITSNQNYAVAVARRDHLAPPSSRQ